MKEKLNRLLTIVVTWTLAGLLMAIYDELARRTLTEGIARYPTGLTITFKTLGTMSGAVVAGGFVVFLFKPHMRRWSFPAVVVVQALTFALIAVAVSWSFGPFAAALQGSSNAVGEGVSRAALFKNAIFSMTLGGLTSFAIEVQDRIGRGAFLAFLVGRYRTARTERRCFMFLDLEDSTPLAERLGHVRYFQLLNAFFADVTDALVETRGEVYQYVGDELIVSWPEGRGIRDASCVRCFLLIERIVSSRGDDYDRRFGTVPRFRAAFHTGAVTTGEVGVLKRERIHTGDTLNVTARIEERCKALGKRALVSGELADSLPRSDLFTLQLLEEVELKGRAGATRIYSLERR